jgi:cytoskeletal protein RodZ
MPGASDTLGERFRAAREARGLSLSDVSDQIRIRSVYLAAIEDENWKAIGAPVYVRGFLRTYARFLGIDPEEAVATFNRAQPSAQQSGQAAVLEAPDGEPPRRFEVQRGSWLVWVAASVAVLLIAFVVYNELTMKRGTTATVAAASPTAAATPVISTPAPTPRQVRTLALVFSAPSWLRVTVDGNVSMEGTFPAGTAKTFHGKNALVRLGNAGGVEVYVDGKDVGKLGKSGDVVEHAFTL